MVIGNFSSIWSFDGRAWQPVGLGHIPPLWGHMHSYNALASYAGRLVIGAGLHWREVVFLRAYCKLLRQAAIPLSQAYMEETLARNPALSALIIRLFRIRFDPGFEGRWVAPRGGWQRWSGGEPIRWSRLRSWGEHLREEPAPLRALLPLGVGSARSNKILVARRVR